MVDSVEAPKDRPMEADSTVDVTQNDEKMIVDNLDSAKDSNDEFPPDDNVMDMLTGVDLSKPLPIVTERYFTPYYRMNFPNKGEDICIRIHTNKLCMISLAPSHEIFEGDEKIVKVDFQVTDKVNRLNNAVSGKAKHGAQPMHETSKICSLTRSDGKSWIVRCGMNGKLTEANADLLENPELVRQPPHKGGYLAIVLPKFDAIDEMKKQWMTQEAYDVALNERLNDVAANEQSNEDSSNENIRPNGTAKRTCDGDVSNMESKEKIMKIEETMENDCKKIEDEIVVSSTLAST